VLVVQREMQNQEKKTYREIEKVISEAEEEGGKKYKRG
jgi:hypothetical protein